MRKANNVLELIGATPIVRLGRVVDADSAEVWGKLESANPGGSVKDRIALAMIDTAALKGEIWAEIYYQRELRHHHKVARCTIQIKPFWSPERTRLTPPGLV